MWLGSQWWSFTRQSLTERELPMVAWLVFRMLLYAYPSIGTPRSTAATTGAATLQPQTPIHDLRRSVNIPHSNHRPRTCRACVRGTLPYPPSTHNGVGGSKGYGRAHVACATPAAVASSASASATTVTTVATTVRSLERRCVRAWHTFHTPPQHTIVLGAARGVCGRATHAVCTAPAAVVSSASTAAHAHAASICSATKPPDFSFHMQ